jgi:pyrimidine operon attenuation protein/uracil phosphoribosyltransferase
LPPVTKVILDDKQIKRALTRIAHEVLEHNTDVDSIAVIGVLTRGAFLAKRIADLIEELEGVVVPVGLMDISLYRDDVHSKLDQPIIQRTDILFTVKDKNIILVDDVLFTGRTVRAALNHIVDFGRPSTIQLAVLIDRGHRELPIKPDYVGVNIPTAKSDQVVVEVNEKDGVDQVSVISDGKAGPKAGKAKKARASSGGKTGSKTGRKGGKK